MKWIGQHIWDFISRFRTTVYLENLETSSDENVLVVDSDGKVTKNTSLGGADLTYNGSTTNGVLTYGSASTIDVESTLTYAPGLLQWGIADDNFNIIARYSNASGDGGASWFVGGAGAGTDADGGALKIIAGNSTGTGTTFIDFLMGRPAASTGSSINTYLANTHSRMIATNTTNDTYFYEGPNSTLVDYFKISVAEHGVTTLSTVDGAAHAADLNITADGSITMTCADEPGGGTVFHLDANADTDNIVDIDAGALDIDASGAITIDGVGVAIGAGSSELDLTTTGTLDVNANALDMNLTDSSGITLTSSEAAEDLEIRVAGAYDSSLVLRSDGTGTDAVIINAAAGSLDIDSADDITIDAADDITITAGDNVTVAAADVVLLNNTSTDGLIRLTSATTGATGIHLDGNAAADSTVDIDAGILDIDVTGATDINSGGDTTISYGAATKFTVSSTDTTSHNRGFSQGPGDASCNYTITPNAHDGAGQLFNIYGGYTTAGTTNNIAGGTVALYGGKGKGTGVGGDITFNVAPPGSSGSTLNAHDEVMRVYAGITDVAHVGIGETTPKTKLSVTHDYDTVDFEDQLSDSEGGGEILRFGLSQADAAGTLHLLAADGATGSWESTDADNVIKGSNSLLGIAIGSDPGVNGMLLRGFYKVASGNIEGTPAVGAAVYVSEVGGKFDFTAPSGVNSFIRVVGYCVDIDSSDILLYFNPDNTWVKHA